MEGQLGHVEGVGVRRFALACVLGALVALTVFAWMVTNGTWNFLPAPGLTTGFFDAQARALLAGHWYMPAKLLTVEGFRVDGHSYMYFGPVPAVLRMPILLITHRLDGRLTPIFMLVAFAVGLLFLCRLAWQVRALVTSKVVSITEAAATAGVIAVVGIGSPFLFQASTPAVYQEAEVWALAFALGAFSFLIAFLLRPTTGSVLLAGLFATLAIMTRLAVGIGPVTALGILACFHLYVAVRGRLAPSVEPHSRSAARFALVGLPVEGRASTWTVPLWCAVLLPLVLYAGVNEEKFHTLFSLPFDDQRATQVYVAQRLALAHNGGSLQGLKFLFTDLVTYLRPDALHLTGFFPWIDFTALPVPFGHTYYAALESTSSISATMPALIALALVGLVAIFRSVLANPSARHGSASPALLLVPVIGAAVGTLGTLTFGYLTNRYLADFVPIVALAGFCGFYVLVAGTRKPVANFLLVGALLVVALFGIWANVALSLVDQRVIDVSSMAPRQHFVALEERLDGDLFGNRPSGVVRYGSHLPTAGLPGSLAILGNCAGLYQSNGMAWEPVEQGPASGSYRLRLTLPQSWGDQYWPLLVNGTPLAGDFLTVHPIGADRVEFAYLFQGGKTGAAWLTSPSVSMRPGHTYDVTVVLDPNIHEIAVSVGDTSVLQLDYFVRQEGPILVGENPLPGPAAATFPGRIEVLPDSLPLCDGLEHRLAAGG